MPQGPTAAQVQAYRFGTRRLAHALEQGSAELVPFRGPRRGLGLVIGAVLAGLLVAGFAVYGLVRPAPVIGDARVLVDSDQGGAYVVQDGVIHPALNIASAMLAAVDGKGGADGSVRQVNGETLASLPHGAAVGIPGAPNRVPLKDQLVDDSWLVCDEPGIDPAAAPGTLPKPRATVIVGLPLVGADPGPAMLVTADHKSYHLVWAGHRSLVGAGSDRTVAAALRLSLPTARTVSLAFLNSIPEEPALTAPQIPGAGAATSVGGVPAKVGDIVRTDSSDGESGLLLVLADGLQPVSPVLADLVRARSNQTQIPTLTPGQVAAAGISPRPIATDRYPASRPVVDTAALPVLCSGWAASDGTARRTLGTVAALPLPAGAKAVPVPPRAGQATPGAVADAVYLTPGRGIVVSPFTGTLSAGSASPFLVTDQGVQYGVAGPAALAGLGLADTVEPVPAHLLDLLPTGPTLDPVAARAFVGQQAGADG